MPEYKTSSGADDGNRNPFARKAKKSSKLVPIPNNEGKELIFSVDVDEEQQEDHGPLQIHEDSQQNQVQPFSTSGDGETDNLD